MEEESEKQIVVVTGCSEGGIGHALAREFASNGCLVAATSRSLTSMSDFQHDHRFFLQELDVLSSDSINAAVSKIISQFGKIDILVNNAGIQCLGALAELPLSRMQDTFNTNVYGPMRMMQAVIPHMAARRKGKVVNVGSVAALAHTPWTGAYTASKAAVHALTDVMRLELKPLGIDVVGVAPGAVKSNVANAAMVSYKQMPESVYYKEYGDAIRRRAYTSQGENNTSAEEFAKRIVVSVMQENPPAWVSYGRYSLAMSVLHYMPSFVKDFVMRRLFM